MVGLRLYPGYGFWGYGLSVIGHRMGYGWFEAVSGLWFLGLWVIGYRSSNGLWFSSTIEQP